VGFISKLLEKKQKPKESNLPRRTFKSALRAGRRVRGSMSKCMAGLADRVGGRLGERLDKGEIRQVFEARLIGLHRAHWEGSDLYCLRHKTSCKTFEYGGPNGWRTVSGMEWIDGVGLKFLIETMSPSSTVNASMFSVSCDAWTT